MANRFVLNETSYHGKGAINEIATEVKGRGFKKCFVCSDPDLLKFGVTKKVTDVLENASIDYEIYSQIKPNPTVENVQTGVAAFKASGADCIIAIGGGSSMDTAKAIGIIITNPEYADVRSLEGAAPTKNKCVPIIAVPTTAGTAAEVTINYVITDVERKRKFVCVDPHDMPIIAVVDPDMMSSMPKGLTASTGMDALTHAIEGYTTLGYYRMGRNCYTKADVEKFRAAVVKYLVPVADQVYREQAKRLGKQYPMSFADNALEFRSGNPRPVGTSDEILAQGMKFYGELSPETKEFFRTMLDCELLDVLSTEGKQAGGYCTSIMDYEVPFIFANFNGTQHDVEVVTHEAGHAFEAWMNRKRIPIDYIWPSMEACEVHSMSMEFFAEPWAEGFFGADATKFRYSHLSGALTFIPYGTMVDEFQHIVYDSPELTPAERNEKWLALERKYRPYMDFGDVDFYSNGRGWQRQLHIYLYPFYYIDYCLAQTAALEFWSLSQKDYKDAWQRYLRFVSFGGKKSFEELCAAAGIDDPFGEHALNGVARTANAWLDSNG